MTSRLEYHFSVRHSISASVFFLSLIALTVAFAAPAQAQINGAPASVTSQGFGGHSTNGTPASVTSLGPHGYAPGPHVALHTSVPSTHHTANHTGNHRHNGAYVPYLYAVPVPYAVDNNAVDDEAAAADDANYQGGPTVFDRRGSGSHSYIPPVDNGPAAHPAQSADESSADPVSDPDPTLLVFKDGRQLEIGNYAIVGSTLFDMTPGHPRKVPLADLNLDATRQQNDNRGVVFELPPSLRTN